MTEDEMQTFATQNGMDLDFVVWFMTTKKDSCGSAWFLMAASMWEGWKGHKNIHND